MSPPLVMKRLCSKRQNQPSEPHENEPLELRQIQSFRTGMAQSVTGFAWEGIGEIVSCLLHLTKRSCNVGNIFTHIEVAIAVYRLEAFVPSLSSAHRSNVECTPPR